jgi:hypothetical protein
VIGQQRNGRAGWLVKEGVRVVYWYGYESPADRGWARDAIASAAPHAPLWCGDVMLPSPFVFPDRAGTWGCGVVLANPGQAEASVLSDFGRALERISRDDVMPGNQPERLTFCQI